MGCKALRRQGLGSSTAAFHFPRSSLPVFELFGGFGFPFVFKPRKTYTQLTWKRTDPCRKSTFLLERAFLHFHVSWWKGGLLQGLNSSLPLIGAALDPPAAARVFGPSQRDDPKEQRQGPGRARARCLFLWMCLKKRGESPKQGGVLVLGGKPSHSVP